MAGDGHSQCFCVPITCAPGDLQWGLIELQGELHVQEERDGPRFPVGTLCQSDFVRGSNGQLTNG